MTVRLLILIITVFLAGCGSQPPPAKELPTTTSNPVPEPSSVPEKRPALPETAVLAEPAATVAADKVVQPVYRPDDERPRHDDAALERVGIHRVASKRLVLYTDRPADEAAALPPLVDALHDELVRYFGPLPPARDRSEFQITGYLMADEARFREAGLVPDDLPPFLHGRHRGRRFWMRDQPYDYYRRHLLLHEATHCVMTLLPGSIGPDWYMEGMAELFGTHRLDEDGIVFRVMPASPEEVAGSGRITLVRQEVAAGRFRSLDEVFTLRPGEFLENEAYAWSWAVCFFLDTHPATRDRFRALGDPRLRRDLTQELRRLFQNDLDELAVEWAAFAQTLRYGYDLERAAIVFRPAEPLPNAGATIAVEAARGWQSSGLRVTAGTRYTIRAEGQFTLANEPKPWVSDAGGISFDYFDERPIGRLLAAVQTADSATAPDAAGGLLTPLEIGREATLETTHDGTLFLRLNDHWDRLKDNAGHVQVQVR